MYNTVFDIVYFLPINIIYLQVTSSIASKKKFIGCNNWKPGEKDHRYLTIPNNIDLELLEILFSEHSYHPHGIDFEVNFVSYIF
jgi:hypothetical protein